MNLIINSFIDLFISNYNKIMALEFFSKSVDDYLESYLSKISKNLNIPIKDLKEMADMKFDPTETPKSAKSSPKAKATPTPKTTPKDVQVELNSEESKEVDELLQMSKPELVELCKAKNLRYSGSKKVLAGRLVGNEVIKKKPEKAKAQPKEKPKEVKAAVINKKRLEKPVHNIERNQYGNYEHQETGFVFNTDKEVYGVQNGSEVAELSKSDIDKCNLHKFNYVLPENLNKNDTLDNVVVDELDDDEEEEEEEEEVDYEEVEEEYEDEEVVEYEDDDELEEEVEYEEVDDDELEDELDDM